MNDALFKILMKIHPIPPILHSGFNSYQAPFIDESETGEAKESASFVRCDVQSWFSGTARKNKQTNKIPQLKVF